MEDLSPTSTQKVEVDLDAKLSKWQDEDGVQLGDDISATVMFDRWSEEDAHMTEEQRENEDRFWSEFEASILKPRSS